MQHLERDLKGWEKVRPGRVAFFVEKSSYADLILDAIFADSYARWGGRFSLIVPCIAGRVPTEYWPWLEMYDPDIVYSYVDQEPTHVLEIHERIAPADYIRHPRINEASPAAVDFRPRYNLALLSSMSTVFRLARHSTAGQGIKVIGSWHTEKPSRLLLDNLGSYYTSAGTGLYPNDAQGSAGLLTIVSDEFIHDRRYGVPQDLDRLQHEYQAFMQFVGRKATGMSLLSALYAPRMEIEDPRWSTAFNLVVGDAFEDRLLFWNARMMIPSWLDGDICCFRVTADDLNDQDFPKLLAHLINSRNHIRPSNGGQSQVRVRSATQNEDVLRTVLTQLQTEKMWHLGEIEVIPGGHAIPSVDALLRARETLHGLSFFHRGVEGKEFHWIAPTARLPAAAPAHLEDAPPGQAFTLGRWVVDLRFEHADDGALRSLRAANHNEWHLPKRWCLAGAFVPQFEIRSGNDHGQVLKRSGRGGYLTMFSSVNEVLTSIQVPTVRDAVAFALTRHGAPRNPVDGDPPWPQHKASWMDASNEADYLVGVLGLAGGLVRAQDLLLHPFLRKVFADLGGTPNLKDSDVLSTANALAKRLAHPLFDLREESERTALAALIAKAAKSIQHPNTWVGLQHISKRWDEYRDDYYAAHPQEVVHAKQAEIEERKGLDDTLAEMRAKRMIFQGHAWKCEACQHRNWTDFQMLKAVLPCDVCGTEKGLPVAVPWHFRANEFLIESLQAHSVLSLLWLLAVLSRQAKTSFLYLEPTRFYYGKEYKAADAETDLIVLIDGQVLLCEIKSAWRSLRISDLESFIALAIRLRPDRAILAVMEPLADKKLGADIDAVAKQLNEAGIAFELLTADAYAPPGEPFLLT
jgi:hypothetical protein